MVEFKPLVAGMARNDNTRLAARRLPPQRGVAALKTTHSPGVSRQKARIFSSHIALKIKLLRESLNTVANAQALNPNGVADLPPPAGEIFSVPPAYVS
jgi:hypothetical protein